jgi:hypothetical protein
LDSFGGIGTFQGVIADSNKKFQLTAAFHKIFLKCIPQSGIALSRRPIALDPAQWVKASISSDFRKALSAGKLAAGGGGRPLSHPSGRRRDRRDMLHHIALKLRNVQ